jgi:hypothetical protein
MEGLVRVRGWWRGVGRPGRTWKSQNGRTDLAANPPLSGLSVEEPTGLISFSPYRPQIAVLRCRSAQSRWSSLALCANA